MKRLSSRFYMALGLSAIVVTCMLLALFAGLVPDRDGAARQTRATLAESTAISITLLLADDSADQRIRQLLGFVVERNPELLSVGLRGADGKLRLWAGDHPQAFPITSDGSSTETHVRLPLMQSGKPWGQAELVFVPLHGEGWKAFLGAPPLMISSVGSLCFFLFYIYLSRTLKHLDPSRVIPGRVRTAFDTLAEGLLVLDPKGQIVLANKAFADVLGLDGDALTGKAVSSLGWTQPVQEGVPPMLWNVVLTEGQAFRNVLMYLPDAQGQRRSFMMNGSIVPGAGGKSAGMLVSLDDVTSLEEKEIQLRLARDAAEAANRAKSDFLANMSHEIRTPMNAILGFAELLKRGWHNGGSQSQRHLDTIVSSGKHLLALINDILDLSKVEAGRMEVERIPCAVHEVVNEVAAIMRVKADEKQIGLDVVYPQSLPAQMLVDPARLRQIITNLVGNALKFTQKGGVRIEVKLLQQSPTVVLGIDVSDSGIGIAQDKLEAIFEPFVQAEASTTRQFGGTGLGLAISRRFARALGGDIRASSVPGQGSTFHVTLDVGRAGGGRRCGKPRVGPPGAGRRRPAGGRGRKRGHCPAAGDRTPAGDGADGRADAGDGWLHRHPTPARDGLHRAHHGPDGQRHEGLRARDRRLRLHRLPHQARGHRRPAGRHRPALGRSPAGADRLRTAGRAGRAGRHRRDAAGRTVGEPDQRRRGRWRAVVGVRPAHRVPPGAPPAPVQGGPHLLRHAASKACRHGACPGQPADGRPGRSRPLVEGCRGHRGLRRVLWACQAAGGPCQGGAHTRTAPDAADHSISGRARSAAA
ncbi:MAG: ATP-binding protein [Rubrivivax sp.]|nr:ATP-binding protein [Rubrivivax sp.]